jgi:hypothetical protein
VANAEVESFAVDLANHSVDTLLRFDFERVLEVNFFAFELESAFGRIRSFTAIEKDLVLKNDRCHGSCILFIIFISVLHTE